MTKVSGLQVSRDLPALSDSGDSGAKETVFCFSPVGQAVRTRAGQGRAGQGREGQGG